MSNKFFGLLGENARVITLPPSLELVWIERSPPVGGIYFSATRVVRPDSTPVIFITGNFGRIFTSLDCINWIEQPAPDANFNNLFNLTYFPISSTAIRLVIVGDLGDIFTSDDIGVTWTKRASGTVSAIRSIAGNLGMLIAVGADGTILNSQDGGVSWSPQVSPIPFAAHFVSVAVSPFPSIKFMVANLAGDIITSSDGITWVYQTLLPRNVNKLYAHGTIMYATSDGGFFQTNDGINWFLHDTGFGAAFPPLVHVVKHQSMVINPSGVGVLVGGLPSPDNLMHLSSSSGLLTWTKGIHPSQPFAYDVCEGIYPHRFVCVTDWRGIYTAV